MAVPYPSVSLGGGPGRSSFLSALPSWLPRLRCGGGSACTSTAGQSAPSGIKAVTGACTEARSRPSEPSCQHPLCHPSSCHLCSSPCLSPYVSLFLPICPCPCPCPCPSLCPSLCLCPCPCRCRVVCPSLSPSASPCPACNDMGTHGTIQGIACTRSDSLQFRNS